MSKIGERVDGGYQVASMPFESEEKAKDWIEQYWAKMSAEPFYCSKDGKWYIVSK